MMVAPEGSHDPQFPSAYRRCVRAAAGHGRQQRAHNDDKPKEIADHVNLPALPSWLAPVVTQATCHRLMYLKYTLVSKQNCANFMYSRHNITYSHRVFALSLW